MLFRSLRKYIDGLFQASFNGYLKGIVFDIASLDYTLIDDFFILQDDVKYYSHCFHENSVVGPYYPFLQSIYDYFTVLSREETQEILEELKIYVLHRPLFMAYFYDEPIDRQPEMLRDEAYFEELAMHVGIIKMLRYISKTRDLVYYLGDIQLAMPSTVKLLERILSVEDDLSILIISTIDTDIISDVEGDTVYDALIEAIEDKEWLMSLDQSYVNEHSFGEFAHKNVLDRIKNLNDCLELLAIHDCIDYGRQLYIEYSNQATISKEKDYLKLLKILSRGYFLIKEKESALFYDNMALSIATEHHDEKEVCEINIKLGYDYSIRGESQMARKYATSALNIAEGLDDELLIYYSKFLHFIIDKEASFNFLNPESHVIESLIDKTIELGYDNHLSMIYTNPYELHDNFTKLKEQRFDKGLELAQQIGNDHQLGVAYHNRGIVFSRIGDMSKAFDCYKKSKEIKQRIGDSRRLAYIYNSLGYYYFLTEQYELSHNEYVKSFNASAKSRDYNEVGMTLYNIALNAFLYGKYDAVSIYMNMLIKLMKTCNIIDLKYHSKKNIYDIYVISLIKNGQVNKGKDLYNKLNIWGLQTIADKGEELFMSKMSEFVSADNPTVAENALNAAEQYVLEDDKSVTHFRKFYIVEKALFYKINANNYFKKVIRMAKKEFYPDNSLETLHKLDIISRQKGIEALPEIDIKLYDIESDYNRIIYTAKLDQNLLRLRNRLNEINFLNIVQNMLINEESMDTLLIRLQQLIHGNTIVEKSFCRVLKKNGYKNVNLDESKLVINEIYAERIFSYITDKSKPHLTYTGNTNLMVLKKVYGYSSIMYLPIYVDHKRKIEFVFMTARADAKLTQDDLGIMTLIGRQIGEAIERINKNKALKVMNHKLKILSGTDLLTGLNNRNALENRLQEEQSNINKGQDVNLISLFIDLDNFKIYNDTYGHSVGDEVLNQFGKILMKVVDKNDFVARFGGDEFVILLKDKSEEEGHAVAHEIYNQLKVHAYFEGTISRLLEQKVHIPKENRLSCSIGLSSLADMDIKDVDQLLKSSDLALYKAKSMGKGQVQK